MFLHINNEEKKDYIKRCVPQIINEETTCDEQDAIIICSMLWERNHELSEDA